jgi:hypothetical protein
MVVAASGYSKSTVTVTLGIPVDASIKLELNLFVEGS